MLLLSSKNLVTVLAAGAATAAAVTSAPAYAVAVLVNFCGPYLLQDGTDTSAQGGFVNGSFYINEFGAFLTDKVAEIQTNIPIGFGYANEGLRTYTEATFDAARSFNVLIGQTPPSVVPGFDPGPSRVYTFGFGSTTDPNNYFSAYLPNSVYSGGPVSSVPVTLTTNIDVRNGFVGKDPDKIFTPVPGPLPFFGIAAAFGASRRLRKKIREHQEQA
jgi:hypothetical protein